MALGAFLVRFKAALDERFNPGRAISQRRGNDLLCQIIAFVLATKDRTRQNTAGDWGNLETRNTSCWKNRANHSLLAATNSYRLLMVLTVCYWLWPVVTSCNQL